MLKMRYEAAMRSFRDPLTGRELCQLTDFPADCVHLYFTENAFVRGKSELVFQSQPDTPGCTNLFALDYETGEVRRLTGYQGQGVSTVSKTPDGRYLLYSRAGEYFCHDTTRDVAQCVGRVPEGFRAGRVSMSCDGERIAMQMNEDVHIPIGANYVGFFERMALIKRSLIAVCQRQGEGWSELSVLVRDTAEGGHLQFSPTNPDLCLFCHEGPWNLVHQRMYLLTVSTGELTPCFRQDRQDCVGHEFFTRDGRIFFDNRGEGHDGTITSERRQAVAQAPTDSAFTPYVGLCDERGVLLARYDMPHYFNHYHAAHTARLLVGDDNDNLALIDLRLSPARVTPLCHHGTSWHGQQTHPHPTVSWDDRHCLFASDQTGRTQLYLLDWPREGK